MKSYKDYLNAEIERVIGDDKYKQEYRNFLKYSKKIKRRQMVQRIIDDII